MAGPGGRNIYLYGRLRGAASCRGAAVRHWAFLLLCHQGNQSQIQIRPACCASVSMQQQQPLTIALQRQAYSERASHPEARDVFASGRGPLFSFWDPRIARCRLRHSPPPGVIWPISGIKLSFPACINKSVMWCHCLLLPATATATAAAS